MKNLILLGGIAALVTAAFMSSNFLKSFLPGEKTDSLNGSWFGIVDIRSLNDTLPALEENEGNAVIRITFSPTIITSLTTYKGKGEITDKDGNVREISFADISVLNSGRIAGFIQGNTMQGSVDGQFEKDKLTLNSGTRTLDLHLQGVLRRGDETNYQHLCKRMLDLGKSK